jgi:acyl-CoA synthetase (AMP-forming)/AMP-acid ligase II
MNAGRTVFVQIIEHLPHKEFQKCVARYHGDRHVKNFSCWDQHLAMAFAQLTYREGLRDIEACLRSAGGKLYHMGFRGFITITDRLSRFSKIAGEMVPHIKIEDKLHELAGITEQVFAVTAVPDERKGERLAVLHTLAENKLAPLLERLAQCDLPALWKPRAAQFLHVEALPYLGTGTLDLRALKAKAMELQPGGSA